MAYRRRHGLSRSSTFKEEIRRSPDDDDTLTSSSKLPHSGSDPRLDSFRTRGSLHSSFKNQSKVILTSSVLLLTTIYNILILNFFLSCKCLI